MKQSPKQNPELYLRMWLERCPIETNKPLTSCSRMTFTLLYNYNALRHPEFKNYKNNFDLKSAQSLAFFVMSMPDQVLSNITGQFDIYRKFLMRYRVKRFKGYKPEDLTKGDKQLLDLILETNPPSDYNHKFAYVDRDFSLIGDLKLMPKLTTREISRLEMIAKERDFNSPVLLYEQNNKLYLTDSDHTLEFNLLSTRTA